MREYRSRGNEVSRFNPVSPRSDSNQYWCRRGDVLGQPPAFVILRSGLNLIISLRGARSLIPGIFEGDTKNAHGVRRHLARKCGAT